MWDEEDDEDELEPANLMLGRREVAAIDAALGTIESTLAELVEQCTRQPADPTELGPRQEAFCRETLMRLLQNPQLMRDEPMYDNASEALRALDQLRPRLRRLQRIADNANRIEWALSEHVLFAAHVGYFALQAGGRAHGLEALHADLSPRRRGSRPAEDGDVMGLGEELPPD